MTTFADKFNPHKQSEDKPKGKRLIHFSSQDEIGNKAKITNLETGAEFPLDLIAEANISISLKRRITAEIVLIRASVDMVAELVGTKLNDKETVIVFEPATHSVKIKDNLIVIRKKAISEGI